MFVDSHDGKWEFRPTLRVLRDFEGRTGVRLFSRVSEALPEDLSEIGEVTEGSARINLKAIVKIFASVIDGIDTAAALLFACRRWVGDGDAPKLNFDEFCDRIGGESIGLAITEAVNILINCVSTITASKAFTMGREGGSGPLGATRGAVSSPSSESQE